MPAYRRDDDSAALSIVSSSRPPTADLRPLSSDFQPQGLNTDQSKAYPTTPPAADCSPIAAQELAQDLVDRDVTAANGDGPTSSDKFRLHSADQVAGLNIMERRLLTLLETTPVDDASVRQGLEQTLSNVHRERAEMELRVGPESVGVAVAALG